MRAEGGRPLRPPAPSVQLGARSWSNAQPIIRMKEFTCPQIALAIGIVLALAFNSSAVTRYLPPGTQDQTALFQSLINQSASGDRIVVQAGNHYLVGTVVVNRS